MTHNAFLRCIDALLAALSAEMDKRGAVDDLSWIENERYAITKAANEWATAHAPLTTVTVADVERVEGLAVGHVDYANKLALYAAELVYGHQSTGPGVDAGAAS